MIEVEGLCKRYGDQLAVEDLSLAVQPGEIYCLLGANGAGKTTTINVLLGFIPPTAGTARIGGVDVTKRPLEARRRVAYLSENVMLYGNLSVWRNLDFFAALSGNGTLDRSAAAALLQRVGLDEAVLSRRVKALSKGMRQKLGLAVCLLKDSSALIMDEPMSGLDPKATVELTAVLLALREAGKALLVSTHDVFRARRIASRVGILRAGRKVWEGNRAELESLDLEALYLRCMAEETVVANGVAVRGGV